MSKYKHWTGNCKLWSSTSLNSKKITNFSNSKQFSSKRKEKQQYSNSVNKKPGM